jgi:diguanylate cyclase
VLQEAGKQKPKYMVAAKAITPLIEKNDWSKLEDQLRKLFSVNVDAGEVEEANWSVLIRNLLKQLEVSHKGVTLSRKKDGLSKVLTNFASDSDVLAQKIQALINSWNLSATSDAITPAEIAANELASEMQPSVNAEASSVSIVSSRASTQWREMLLRTFELVLIPHLQAVSEHQQKAIRLLSFMRQANSEQTLSQCVKDLNPVLLSLEMERDHQQRIHESLSQLLRLLVASMGELVLEDQWLYAQTTVIEDIISKPLNINTLYDAESSLRELTYKQSQLKPALTEAKDTHKKMVTTFVDRLAEMTESTTDYHDKIEGYQKKIATTEEIVELN